MDDEFGDMGPPVPKPDPREKQNRQCNWCGKPLNEFSPSWFQCSEACQKARYKQTRRDEGHRDEEDF